MMLTQLRGWAVQGGPVGESLFLQGIAHHTKGNYENAEQAYRAFLKEQPDHVDAQSNLGHALWQMGRHDEAISCYRNALALSPAHATTHNNLGAALLTKGRAEEALHHLDRALLSEPHHAMAHNNRGTALKMLGRMEEALESFAKALSCRPGYAAAENNLGLALRDLGHLEESVRHFQRALDAEPESGEALTNLAGALLSQGRVQEGIECYRRALALPAPRIEALTGLLLALHYLPTSAGDLFSEHREYHRRFEAPLMPSWRPHPNPVDAERRLHIGYLSPDLRRHSVASFIEPVLLAHNRERFRITLYASVARPDEVTRRLAGLCDAFHDVHRISDEELAQRVRADGVDILVELAGHTSGNRLLAVARRPAPIQVTYLGYPNTTGLSAIDYRLTDDFCDPPGQGDGGHSERLYRLPSGFLCYLPPNEAPPVSPLPALSRGAVSFGCFNNLPKLTDRMIALFSEILGEVRGSRLILKSAGLSDAATRQRVRDRFSAQKVPDGRIELRGLLESTEAHLASYHDIDIALDTFPYHGTTTTCEALWMGVPVVTLCGESHRSRVGASLLMRAGLPDLITRGERAYVKRAVELARDLAALSGLRAGMRERLRASPLLDAQRTTRSIEAAYRHMWRSYCRLPPG